MKPTPDQVMFLLRLALGSPLVNVRIESRFRNMQTGEIKTKLDYRVDARDEWLSEDRTVAETHWDARLL